MRFIISLIFVPQDSGYHPEVEAISPTGPEAARGDRDDHIRATKDDLVQKIKKIDHEILKAETQIAKFKKKQVKMEKIKQEKIKWFSI